ncbi:MAG: ribbon-helix-helix domain-containing protein [Magnetovibrio sp.]|nr:ribbon-helix-helix domain-containing protein [Magnetovibrio sp.]
MENEGETVSQNLQSKLQSRNVSIGEHRTSLRLERDTWDALEEICVREHLTVHELCTSIEQYRTGASRTAAVRAHVLTYFRAAATDAGHAKVKHGSLTGLNRKKYLPRKLKSTSEILINL